MNPIKFIKNIIDQGWRPLTIGSGPMHINPQARRLLDEYNEWLSASVDRIASSVSLVDFKLMEYRGKEVKEVEAHPLIELLNKPNSFTTRTDFLYLLTVYLLMTGEAPIRLRKKDIKEQPQEMELLIGSDLTVNVGTTDDGFEVLVNYEINKGGKNIKLEPWQVVFINNPNPKDPWRGIGVVEKAARTLDQLTYAEQHNINFFKNSAIPSVALYTDQKLGEDTFNRLKNNWDSNYRGHQNSHKTAILEAGLKIEKLMNTAKDMDFVKQQEFMRDKLIAIIGTSKAILGYVDANRASAEASEYIFNKYTVKPIVDKIYGYLNEYLVPIYGDNLFLVYNDPVIEDKEQSLAYYDKAVNRWMTQNEIRAREGLEPVDGGDYLITLGEKQLVPRSKKSYEKEIRMLQNRNLKKKRAIEIIKSEIRKQIKITPKFKGVKYKDPREKQTLDKFVEYRMEKAREYDVKLEERILKVFEWQEREIIRNLRSKSKSVDDYLFNRKASISMGIDLTTPVIEALIREFGAEAFLLLGISRDYSMLAAAQRYLRIEPKKYSRSLTNTAYRELREMLALGLKEGKSIPELVKDVRAKYVNIKKTNLENIVRTEVTRAFSFATEDAYSQSGVVKAKRWLVTKDERLCEFCMSMESLYENRSTQELGKSFFKLGDKVQGVDPLTGEPLRKKDGSPKVFEVDYSDIDAPPLHPRCRCDIVPVLDIEKTVKIKKKIVKKKPVDLLKEIDRELDDIKRAKIKGVKS